MDSWNLICCILFCFTPTCKHPRDFILFILNSSLIFKLLDAPTTLFPLQTIDRIHPIRPLVYLWNPTCFAYSALQTPPADYVRRYIGIPDPPCIWYLPCCHFSLRPILNSTKHFILYLITLRCDYKYSPREPVCFLCGCLIKPSSPAFDLPLVLKTSKSCVDIFTNIPRSFYKVLHTIYIQQISLDAFVLNFVAAFLDNNFLTSSRAAFAFRFLLYFLIAHSIVFVTKTVLEEWTQQITPQEFNDDCRT